MRRLCATCTSCLGIIPKQKRERVLVKYSGGIESRVLVIDNLVNQDFYTEGMMTLKRIMGDIPFEYTSTIRCDYDPLSLGKEESHVLKSRCSVWTNLLLENRSVILATEWGLEQMKVGKDKEEGDAFRVGKLGVVLCIPPILGMSKEDESIYRVKVQRVLRAGGIRT